MTDLPASARAGHHKLPGQVWRRGDPNKHLGPPESLQIEPWSRLFQTRCGLTNTDGAWSGTKDDDNVWCPDCLSQAGIPYELIADRVTR